VQRRPSCAIERTEAAAYRIPTDASESDGTFAWDATTLVTVEVEAGGVRGFGYTYGHAAAVPVIRETLAGVIRGGDALDTPGAWLACLGAMRNVGLPGIAATAVSAVDAALWDLKGKLLAVPLVELLGVARPGIPAYASGGFTSYDVDRLRAQLAGWVEQGFTMVKMKVGRDPAADPARVEAARSAVGPGVRVFVDANGAYTRKQALLLADRFAEQGVAWFEEPLGSDDLEGLRLLRDRAPAGMSIAAGEYAYDPFTLRQLLGAGAVDVLQADATRCLGITGFLHAAALAFAFHVPLSAHCAPSLHVAPLCAAPAAVHAEWFHDHARIETRYLDGAPVPERGVLRPDRSRPGLGLEPRKADLQRFAV
jgi:L-alanine-DL-glutamate epimerase-like enolase superfamily enzyme